MSSSRLFDCRRVLVLGSMPVIHYPLRPSIWIRMSPYWIRLSSGECRSGSRPNTARHTFTTWLFSCLTSSSDFGRLIHRNDRPFQRLPLGPIPWVRVDRQGFPHFPFRTSCFVTSGGRSYKQNRSDPFLC